MRQRSNLDGRSLCHRLRGSDTTPPSDVAPSDVISPQDVGTTLPEPDNHRPQEITCDSERPVSENLPGPDSGEWQCALDSDYTDGDNGRCTSMPRGGWGCSCDTCFVDSDCGDSVCACNGAWTSDANACREGNCQVNSDCGEGGWCNPSYSDCGDYSGVTSYFCRTQEDECLNDSDCTDEFGGYCMFNSAVERWGCSYSHFEPVAWTDDALRELGRRAFEGYPVQLNEGLRAAASTESGRNDYGFWLDTRGRVGGLVTVALPSGRTDTALTCATCHAATDDNNELSHGQVNPAIDIGRYNAHRSPPGESQDRLLAWGPGRVDVTPDERDNPTAIGDLRAVRFQSHLHSAATLHNDLTALAVRIETLIITSLGEVVRPPRELTFTMAWYLWTLEAPALRPAGTEEEGEAIFERTCSRCHQSNGTTSGPVSIAEIGTDSAVAESPARGTGTWRVPTLWGASTRTQLLHTASVRSIAHLLDPVRLEETPGHPFGTTLEADGRAALVRFVETIGD